METSFFWFGVFSGSFGVRSIVLCKCSGKYIDIYFILKITFQSCILTSYLNFCFFSHAGLASFFFIFYLLILFGKLI